MKLASCLAAAIVAAVLSRAAWNAAAAGPNRRQHTLFRHLRLQRPELQFVYSCYFVKHGNGYMM